jgi:hypothetical protein
MNFNKLIPELSVSNIKQSIQFYQDTLGFTIEYSRPKDKFYFLSSESSQIMIEEINNTWWTGELEYPFRRGVNFQIEVCDVSALVERLDEANIPLFCPPKESWYGSMILIMVRLSSSYRTLMDTCLDFFKVLAHAQ